MSWPYQYTPYIWPMLASASFMFAIAFYGWRHRAIPGALAFSVGSAFAGLWAVGNACELSATDQGLQFLWFRFQMVLSTPAAVGGLCFVLQYAGLGRWLNRATLTLLIAPIILMLPAYLVDDAHLLWGQLGYADGRFVRTLAPLGVAWNLYGLAVLSVTVAVVMAMFVRSPLLRKPAALILLGHTAIVGVQALEIVSPPRYAPLSLMILSIDFAFAMYAIALYRYRLFDVVPVARATAVERMADALVVLDALDRVVDVNLAAQQLLGSRQGQTVGRPAAQVLAAVSGLMELIHSPEATEGDVWVGQGPNWRYYRASVTPLTDSHGFGAGRVLLLHDVTQLIRAQEQLLQQERALAALRERELLARELHDGVGQVLGFVSLQAEAACKLLDDGKSQLAAAQLGRLSSVARDAHADVREFILALRAAPSEQRAFFPALSRYLEGFSHNYGLQAQLSLPDGLDDSAFTPEARAQLFRIIQEALSNARKHGGARSVRVSFETEDCLARVVVLDDGAGFDAQAQAADGGGFGLRFMRERAAELGGSVEIESARGEGTRVVVELPLRKPQAV